MNLFIWGFDILKRLANLYNAIYNFLTYEISFGGAEISIFGLDLVTVPGFNITVLLFMGGASFALIMGLVVVKALVPLF